MGLQLKLLLAALLVFAAMAAGVFALHGFRLILPGLECGAWKVETLYNGSMPRSLSVDVDVASVRIYYDPGAPEARVVLWHSGGCVHGEAYVSGGELRVKVWDSCRMHMFDCSKARLTIILPRPTLRRLSLVLDVGDAKVDDIAADTMILSVDVGNAVAYNVTVSEMLMATADVGRLALRSIHMPENATARVSANVGSVELYLERPGAWIEEVGGGSVAHVTYSSCKPARGPHIYVASNVGSVNIVCVNPEEPGGSA